MINCPECSFVVESDALSRGFGKTFPLFLVSIQLVDARVALAIRESATPKLVYLIVHAKHSLFRALCNDSPLSFLQAKDFALILRNYRISVRHHS